MQAKLALYATPVVLSSAIADEQKKLTSTTDPIMNKPKPKPPKVEPPPDNADAKKEDAKMDSAPVNGEGEVSRVRHGNIDILNQTFSWTSVPSYRLKAFHLFCNISFLFGSVLFPDFSYLSLRPAPLLSSSPPLILVFPWVIFIFNILHAFTALCIFTPVSIQIYSLLRPNSPLPSLIQLIFNSIGSLTYFGSLTFISSAFRMQRQRWTERPKRPPPRRPLRQSRIWTWIKQRPIDDSGIYCWLNRRKLHAYACLFGVEAKLRDRTEEEESSLPLLSVPYTVLRYRLLYCILSTAI